MYRATEFNPVSQEWTFTAEDNSYLVIKANLIKNASIQLGIDYDIKPKGRIYWATLLGTENNKNKLIYITNNE